MKDTIVEIQMSDISVDLQSISLPLQAQEQKQDIGLSVRLEILPRQLPRKWALKK